MRYGSVLGRETGTNGGTQRARSGDRHEQRETGTSREETGTNKEETA